MKCRGTIYAKKQNETKKIRKRIGNFCSLDFLGATTLSMMTFSIMTDTQHNNNKRDTKHNDIPYC